MARIKQPVHAPARVQRDVITVGIAVAAILLFVGIAGPVVSAAIDLLTGGGSRVDAMLATALLLNIALLLFGWRRYRDYTAVLDERIAAEEQAHALAHKDPLTGLANRRSLAEGASTLLRRAATGGKAVALIMIDLDHFKSVNDLHGHAAGDALLASVGKALLAVLPPSATVARLGGDEFAAAMLFDPVNPSVVAAVADNLVERLCQPFDLDGAAAHVSASIGVATTDHECVSFEALMRRGDIAMYAAKKAGRNRATWFDATMERELLARNAVEAGLRTGIPAGEIIPYYEQQIDLATGRLIGFEMLARWQHPTRGLIPPDVFIPIAEETGQIGALSLSVMRRAFEDAKAWDPSLSLSVNISPGQLRDPWLAQKIVKLLVETGFPPTRLEIEITESSLFENLGLAQSIVGSLKNQGIRLALDDFGTGYSSLAHLRALPFDRIKIDRSFVTSMDENPESAAIVDAITKLGGSLGMPITAEGIETAAIEARLKVLGCHKGQGWHFGKPIPIAQVRKLLAEQALLPAARGQAKSDDNGGTMRRAG